MPVLDQLLNRDEPILSDSYFAELIEEKRQAVKEEVDTLIAQWKNVNVDEILGKDHEQLPGQIEDQVTDATWENDSDQNVDRLVANGSSNTNESSNTSYSAKERRIKRKGAYIVSRCIFKFVRR